MICLSCLEPLGRTWNVCPGCQFHLHPECWTQGCPRTRCQRVRWRDLTEEQLDLLKQTGILNGCGGKGSWVPVPDFLFRASCWHHDWNYWLGGTEADRLKADWQFYQAMLEDAGRARWAWQRWWYRRFAWLYYQAVRRWGARFFNHGPEKTRTDLALVLRRAG